MAIETGVVKMDKYAKAKNKFGKYSILVDIGGEERWVATNRAPLQVSNGDKIKFNSGDTGKYISQVKVLGGGSVSSSSSSKGGFSGGSSKAANHGDFQFPIPESGNYQRAVQRSNALEAAAMLASAGAPKKLDASVISAVLLAAREFESYLTGADLVVAKEAKKPADGKKKSAKRVVEEEPEDDDELEEEEELDEEDEEEEENDD